MPFYLAEIGKKSYLLAANSLASASEMLTTYYKGKLLKLEEGVIFEPLKFRLAGGTLCTSVKVKDTVVHFTTDNNMSGKVDISLLPIERA